MKNKYYTSRDPIKNYFPLPNEVFDLGLSPGALAVYSYLMYIEDRTTYQCHASYSVRNGLRDTLEGYYKSKTRQHNPLSQQKEFRAIKNAIIQEAEHLRQQIEQAQTVTEQESSPENESSNEKTSSDTSTNPTLADDNTSFTTSHSARLPSEYLLNSTVRLFHQIGRIFRDNAAPPSNPMGIRMDSKRRKKLIQKRLAMGHKQDDHEQAQGYEQSL